MFPIQTTQKFNFAYLILTLLTISKTNSELPPGLDPQTAIFPNQTCQNDKFYKFNLELIQGNWKFLLQEVTPSCCAFVPHNVTTVSQVTLEASTYRMAETTHNTMPPQQDYEEDYTGPPQISDITARFSTKGFPQISNTDTDSDSTVLPVQNIPQPAAQKMAIATKVTTSLARFFKKAACEGENAVECLARQTISLINHQAIPVQNTPPPATTVQPELVKIPCKIDPSKPGCYAWADMTNKIIAPVLNRIFFASCRETQGRVKLGAIILCHGISYQSSFIL